MWLQRLRLQTARSPGNRDCFLWREKTTWKERIRWIFEHPPLTKVSLSSSYCSILVFVPSPCQMDSEPFWEDKTRSNVSLHLELLIIELYLDHISRTCRRQLGPKTPRIQTSFWPNEHLSDHYTCVILQIAWDLARMVADLSSATTTAARI